MHGSATTRHGTAAVQAPIIPLGQRERRIIFAEMVKAELQAGLVRYSKRRQLLRYAQKMGVPPFEAQLIIARVQHGHADDAEFRLPTPAEIRAELEQKPRHPVLHRFLIAAGATAILHGALLGWVLYW